MRGRWISAALVLALSAGLAAADDIKSDKSDKGGKKAAKTDKAKSPPPNLPYGMSRVEKVDADKGEVVFLVQSSDGPKEEKVKVGKGTVLVRWAGGKSKEYTGKDVLKHLKEGAIVRLQGGGQRIELNAGGSGYSPSPRESPRGTSGRGQGPEVEGTVRRIDADKGVLLIRVEGGKDQEVRVNDDTRFMVPSGEKYPQMLNGKKGLKAKGLRKGSQVRVQVAPDGSARAVMVSGKGENKNKKEEKEEK